MTEKPKRQYSRRDARAEDYPPIRLTDRDFDVLQAVYECRVLTTQHLQALFFPSQHRAYERLAALYHHGLLERRFLGVYADKMNTPILYMLDRRGADLLSTKRGLDIAWSSDLKQVGVQFLEHTLAINSVRVAFTKACQMQVGVRLLHWHSEADLKATYDRVTIRGETGKPVSISLIPDSYFALETPLGIGHFFLELDRGTMEIKRFKQKILAYQAYHHSGAYEQRYRTTSMRVLTVTLSQIRADHLKAATESAGGKLRFWFTTLDQLAPAACLTAPLWQVASQTELFPLIDVAQG